MQCVVMKYIHTYCMHVTNIVLRRNPYAHMCVYNTQCYHYLTHNRLIDAKDAADRRKERRILIQKEQAERAKQRDELKILQVNHTAYNIAYDNTTACINIC